MTTYIALENLRSLHNIGAIFRTCSFFGFYNVLLVGYSGKAKDHYDRVILHPELTKTALSSEHDLNITFIEDTSALIAFSNMHKLDLIAIEQAEESISYKDFKNEDANDKILVLGNEVTGVSSEVLSASKVILEIPKIGNKGSLNVSTACGIILANIC